MPRAGSISVLSAMLLALIAGGLFSTGAWLYQSGGLQPQPAVELLATPVLPVAASPVSVSGDAKTPVPSAPSAPAGQSVYRQFCDGCHPGGDKGMGPALRGAEFQAKYAEDAALKKITVEGVGIMPGFPQLSAAQLDELVAYIRSLD